MPYIEHQYGTTYYQSRGSKRAKGLPLICLHGGPGGHSQLMTDMFALSDERRVFIYDQVGGGRSSATNPRRWTVNTFVRELQILANAWGLDRFHLFGASWGTTLALEYYLKHPSRIASLQFQSPMFSTQDWENDANRLISKLPAIERKVIRYCHEIDATDSAVYQDAMKLYYSRHVCRNKARSKRAAKIKNPNGNKIYEHMWGASEFHATGTLRHYDRVKSLDSITCPTQLICGEHDEAQPRTAKRYAKRIAGAGFVEIKNASHAILGERPKQLVKTMREFLHQIE